MVRPALKKCGGRPETRVKDLRKVAQRAAGIAAGTGSRVQTQSHLIIFLWVVARTL